MQRTSSHCRNCGAFAPDAFCPSCGQETREHPPTFWEFVHEFVTHYLAFEGALWRSLKALVFKPGFLTLEYLAGRKRKYVLPLRLYLTISIVFFVALRLGTLLVPGEQLKASFDASNLAKAEVTVLDIGIATIKRNADGSFTCTLPAAICSRVQQRLAESPQEMQRRVEQMPSRLLGNLSSAMFLMLPVFALCLKLLYPSAPFGTHMVFAFHQHCLWFLLMLLLMLPWWPTFIEALVMMWLLISGFIALKKVYGRSWVASIASGAAVSVLYIAALVTTTTVLLLAAFLV
jgi:hypothetical protein